MTIENELRPLLIDFITEFGERKSEILSDPKLSLIYKQGNYANKGAKRNGGHSIHSGVCFNFGIFYQLISWHVNKFKSSEKIYQYISENNFWHTKYASYQECINNYPSLIGCIAGGFLCRNFEINNEQFLVTDDSFEKAYIELSNFFKKDHVTYDWYIHLQGVVGELNGVQLTDDVSIIRADFQLAKFFSINYSGNDISSDIEVFEDDYLLKIKTRMPKEKYEVKISGKVRLMEQTIERRWKNLVLLGLPGYVNFGKQIKLSDDWPIVYLKAIGPYGNKTIFPYQSDSSTITNETILSLYNAVKIINTIDSQIVFDKKIIYAIERLTKSKSSLNIDDRVVELSIALEFLINTDDKDVTLQLCLKLIKLLYDSNQDEQIYPKLKKFYALRSKIIHGSDKIKADENNKAIISFAEDLIQRATLRLMELNQKFDYKKIDLALVKSLHVSKPFITILNETVIQ